MLGFIGSQFKKPTGLLGKIVSRVMKKGNRPEYDKIIPELDIQQNDRIPQTHDARAGGDGARK